MEGKTGRKAIVKKSGTKYPFINIAISFEIWDFNKRYQENID
jgi:hypothetical protein